MVRRVHEDRERQRQRKRLEKRRKREERRNAKRNQLAPKQVLPNYSAVVCIPSKYMPRWKQTYGPSLPRKATVVITNDPNTQSIDSLIERNPKSEFLWLVPTYLGLDQIQEVVEWVTIIHKRPYQLVAAQPRIDTLGIKYNGHVLKGYDPLQALFEYIEQQTNRD